MSRVIDIIVSKNYAAPSEDLISWRHRISDICTQGSICRFISHEPMTYNERIKAAKQSALSITGFSADEVRFTVRDNRG